MKSSNRFVSLLFSSAMLVGGVVSSAEVLAQQRGGDRDRTRTPTAEECQRDYREAQQALDTQDTERARDRLSRLEQCCPDQQRSSGGGGTQDRIRDPSTHTQ
jgi:hypothetical protein